MHLDKKAIKSLSKDAGCFSMGLCYTLFECIVAFSKLFHSIEKDGFPKNARFSKEENAFYPPPLLLFLKSRAARGFFIRAVKGDSH